MNLFMPDKMIATNWILYSALYIGCACQTTTLEAHIDQMLGISILLLTVLGLLRLVI